MKIKTALITILFCFLFPFSIYAEDFGVDVSADIEVDLFSQLSLLPSTVEINQSTQVRLNMLDSSGDPMANRDVNLYIDGSSTGVSITQPPLTNAYGQATGYVSSTVVGSYNICAVDVTEGYDIYVQDCETLYVVPVTAPVMIPEPQYTKGTANTVAWSHSGSNTYQYQVQVSTNASFGTILKTSSWISSTSYEFTDLSNSQIYFYRVIARNQFGGVSSWSGSVYSIQDSSKPTITLLNISDVGENTIEEWDTLFVVTITVRIEDNVGIDSNYFYCVLQGGSLDECPENMTVVGETYSYDVSLGDLEKDSNYDLYPNYNFCVEASDTVGNVERMCDINLTFEHQDTDEPEPEPGEPEPEPTKPPVIIEKIQDTVKEIVHDVTEVIDDTIGQLEEEDLETVTVTTTAATVTVGIGALLAGLGYLPYALLEIFLSILSFFGFRKKGSPTGYVYNSITKEPISQAIVRIFDENNSLVWTDVTDGNGYFNASEFDNGEYSIVVMARNFEYPSKIVFGKEDFPLDNVYHGKEFIITEGRLPNFSIPLDPVESSSFKKSTTWLVGLGKLLFRILHLLLFVFGLIFSIYLVYTSGLWWSYILVGLYVPSLVLLTINLFGKREKWGTVKDVDGDLIEGVVVGLKEREFGKLVSKRVTDDEGKYRFVVDVGEYELVILNTDLVLSEETFVSVKRVNGEDNVIVNDLSVKQDVVKKKSTKKKKKDSGVMEALPEL